MRHFVLFIFFISFFSLSYGQKIKYRDVKEGYTFDDYFVKVEDKTYHPVLAAVCNFYFPGLGHVYVNETLRGIGFFGGTLTAGGVAITGLVMGYAGNNEAPMRGEVIMYTGLGAYGLIHLWSILDVVKVSMVKNVAYDKKKKQSISIDIHPRIDLYHVGGNAREPMIGATANIYF